MSEITKKIEKLIQRSKKISEQIRELQRSCPHSNDVVQTTRTVVGHNGFGTDYHTYHYCTDCRKSWSFDGYSVFDDHVRKS